MNPKEILALINKIAQELPDPPGVTTGPAPGVTRIGPSGAVPPSDELGTPPGVVRIGPSGVMPSTPHRGGGTSVAIMGMQHELMNLAKMVSSQINLNEMMSKDLDDQRRAKDRDAFGVFLTKNYMRNSDVRGVEFDPNPKSVTMQQKNPHDPTRMSIVMDTMARIGRQVSERWADGSWGPRTNAALHNAYAFAFGLLNFVDDVNRFSAKKLLVHSYTRNDLRALSHALVDDPSMISPPEKNRIAPLVANHLKGIERLYNEVKTKILEFPTYQQFIEGDSTFKTYQAKGPLVTSQQIDSLRNAFPNGFVIEVSPNQKARVEIQDLVSLPALQKWITNMQAKVSPSEIVKQIREQVTPGY